MTDEEVLALHKAYHEQHKKAFRVAFDTLTRLWPPETDPEKSAEWFRDTACPMCMDAYFGELKDNPLGKALMEAVYGYLDRMAVELREKADA